MLAVTVGLCPTTARAQGTKPLATYLVPSNLGYGVGVAVLTCMLTVTYISHFFHTP